MYSFEFSYIDGTVLDYDGIIEVQYYSPADIITVQGNEILRHNFPIGRDIYLFAEDAKHTASGKNLKSISVYKE